MNSYLFDVDGVLTNPDKMDEINFDTLPFIINLLQKDNLVGFITGRGLVWLRAKLIKGIEKYVEKHAALHNTLLDQVYISGEFGGVSCLHKNNVRQEFVNHNLILPEEVKRGLHLVAFEFSDSVYIETEKQTIFTVSKNHALKTEDFLSKKNIIIREFYQIISSYPEIEIQSDIMSINVRYKKANKKYATNSFLAWLKEKGLAPDKYFVFGDSPSDIEMGEELKRQNLLFEFIYVGEQSDLANLYPKFQIIYTRCHFDEGTIEYLKSYK